MFTFTPLQGALSESAASQSLLELDGGVKVLVDVGWDETFDVEKLRELEKQVPTLSLILLTHATISHLGAYAHCCKHFPLFTRIPVYATRPVIDLGRTLTQDLYASTPLAATTIPRASLAESSYSYAQASSADHSSLLLQPPTAEEIARYFSLIQPLKYSQPHQPLPSPFSPPLNGLTITAYNAGHTLGGTIWHIQHGLESVVYAVDWNQARENVFSGAAWLGGGGAGHGAVGGAEVMEQLRKPTALVCSSRTPETALPRARRDEQLLESVRLCIARGGTVLIPVDSSARVLELAYLLEHAWRSAVAGDDDVFRSARLYLAGRSVGSTMRNARSMLEWMDDGIVREFEAVAGGSRTGNGPGSGGPGSGGPGDGAAAEVGSSQKHANEQDEQEEKEEREGSHKRQKLDGGGSPAPGSAEPDGTATTTSPATTADKPTTTTTSTTTTTTTLPTLDVLPPALASAARSAAQPLHVGDLRLADLRRAMLAGGHKAEFRGEGTLLIDGVVAVRKTAAGRVEVESVGMPLPADSAAAGGMGTFYEVRKRIYEGLAVVAGA
ncbi:hypothetical protein VTH06DRAFT_5503 [Thermothelomyces fergusii]